MPSKYDNAGRRIVPKRLQEKLRRDGDAYQMGIALWAPLVGSPLEKKTDKLTIRLIEARGLPRHHAGIYAEVYSEAVTRLRSDLRRLADKIAAKEKIPYGRAIEKAKRIMSGEKTPKRTKPTARKKPKKMRRIIRP